MVSLVKIVKRHVENVKLELHATLHQDYVQTDAMATGYYHIVQVNDIKSYVLFDTIFLIMIIKITFH